MKFGVGVAVIVFGYALFYQGMYMTRWYDPKTGTLPVGGIPPMAVLLGLTPAPLSKDVEKNPATIQPPFSWETPKKAAS